MCLDIYSRSGSSQRVEEGARSPKPFSEYGRILPYAYAQVVLEAEGRPRREHHAVFFGEPAGKLEGRHIKLGAQEGQQSPRGGVHERNSERSSTKRLDASRFWPMIFRLRSTMRSRCLNARIASASESLPGLKRSEE